jgi:hypothetical protein
MVTLRVWNIVMVGIVLAMLSQEAVAADQPAPKSECPQECQRRAKAAFAFAALKAAAAAKPTTAPMPKPVEPKVGKLCCCENCQCAPGDCPSKCPVDLPTGRHADSPTGTGIGSFTNSMKPTLPPTPTQRTLVIVRYECKTLANGQRVCVPVYEER